MRVRAEALAAAGGGLGGRARRAQRGVRARRARQAPAPRALLLRVGGGRPHDHTERVLRRWLPSAAPGKWPPPRK